MDSKRPGQPHRSGVSGAGPSRPPGHLLPVAIFVAFSCTAIYFAGSAVAPALAADWRLSASEAAALSWAVQAGFIAGTLITAALNLPDRIRTDRLIAALLVAASVANWCFTLAGGDLWWALALRFCAGALGGPIYPIVMRLLATWFSRLGWQLGLLIGAYTAGSGAGFLLRAAAVPWQQTLASTSAIALAGAVLSAALLRSGPLLPARSPLDLVAAARAFGVADYRRSAFAYFGHMWELFAFWMLMPFWLAASGLAPSPASVLAGLVFVAGAAGCVAAGAWSMRIGEARVARVALAASGACCLASPFLFSAPAWLLAPFVLLWGAAVIADSGMYSSISARSAPRQYVGTALTTQNSIGFAITIASIALVPVFATWAESWRFALQLLAPGPLLGLIPLRALVRSEQSLG